jgi:hypothetical protein
VDVRRHLAEAQARPPETIEHSDEAPKPIEAIDVVGVVLDVIRGSHNDVVDPRLTIAHCHPDQVAM